MNDLLVFGLAFLGVAALQVALVALAAARRLRDGARAELDGAEAMLAEACAIYADAQAALAAAWAAENGHPAAATITAALPVLIGPDHERGTE